MISDFSVSYDRGDLQPYIHINISQKNIHIFHLGDFSKVLKRRLTHADWMEIAGSMHGRYGGKKWKREVAARHGR